MKKMLIAWMTLCVMSVTFANDLLPILTGPKHFPSSSPGIIYSDATRSVYRESKADLKQYKILGKVQTQATMENILLLVNVGDTSLGKLKSEALKKYPQADDIVNIELDVISYNILIFYLKTTVTMRGIAVKFKN